jgi:hypothetical protein
MCSDDAGASFGPFVALGAGAAGVNDPHLITGAFGHGAKKNELAAVWYGTPAGSGSQVFFALSKDAGKTFGTATSLPVYTLPDSTPTDDYAPDVMFDDAGVIWVAYVASDGGQNQRLVVDKSCDDGATWSGAVLVNGTEMGPMIDSQGFPGLYQAKGKVGVLGMAPTPDGAFAFKTTSLVP